MELDQVTRALQQRLSTVVQAYPRPQFVDASFWYMLQAMAAHSKDSLVNACLELGTAWGPGRTREAENRGKQKECFRNAADWAIADERLTYVEGFACTRKLALAIHHAWLVDADGFVLDPTWKDGHSYCGLPLKRDSLARVLLETGIYGVFGSFSVPDWFARDLQSQLAPVVGQVPRVRAIATV